MAPSEAAPRGLRVAIFQLHISAVQRSLGRRATAAAAYRAGERIRDERSGEWHDHSRRCDVAHTEIFLPAQFDGIPPNWARSRAKLWNAAEQAENRRNSRVAREFQVTLPHELSAAQRLSLARAFSQEIANRYKVAVDLAVHDPRPDADPRHFHAHLLTTTREITPEGLAAKSGLDMSDAERQRLKLPDHRQEYVNVRKRWATLTNAALREANVDARIDHRTLAAQGIDREPLPHIPLAQLKMERRGVPSLVAQRLRAEYRKRVQGREERSANRTAAKNHEGPTQATASAAGVPGQPADMEEIRRQAREAWLRLRSKEVDKAGGRGGERETLQGEAQPKDELAR
jgi:ATP-dependent exoDNAse (exonuclease V) alpha subunit